MITYKLNRSDRKTIGLYVRNGEVEVRAPLGVSKGDIDLFVASKEKWIAGKLAASAERREKRAAFALDYGDTALYLGNEYPIAAVPGDRLGFDGERFYMPPGLDSDQIKYACVQIYRMLANRDLPVRARAFAQLLGVMPAAVKINSAKTRWGSCSNKKSLNFSWRLIMAQSDVVDYVVVHELAHIIELNHSDRFWKVIEGALPDYRELRGHLDDLHKRLIMEDWD